MTLTPIARAIADIKAGRMVVVVDDEDRENEGDLVCAAELITTEIVNFMARHGRGWICLALTPDDCDRLELPQMVERNTESMLTAFTVTIDAERRFDVTTGISASDRATTIRVAIDPDTTPADLRRPGHIQPLRAQRGGVLRRVGHTEASVDLARLGGLRPAGVICEILNPDGSMARLPDLQNFAAEHGLSLIAVADLVAYRLRTEQLVHRVAEARLPTEFGEFRVIGYRNDVDRAEHVALVFGDVAGQANVPVRMHSKCLTGDVFHSLRCDCGIQLHRAMELITREGRGVIVYLDQEGRGIGLLNKLRAYELQDHGADTVDANLRLGFDADMRGYALPGAILNFFQIPAVRLMSNNPEKIQALERAGVKVAERVSAIVPVVSSSEDYLRTKREKMGHLLE